VAEPTQPPWHQLRLCAFDLETTAPNPHQARIVQYALAHLGGGQAPDTTQQIVDPGVEIPQGAIDVHGITNEQARAEGVDAGEATAAIALAIGGSLVAGEPLVGHNISYDLTVLDAECRRHLNETLTGVIGREVAPVIDTLVLSKAIDPYRKRVSPEQGAHVLKTCVQALLPAAWGITWDDEQGHGALYDCLMAARVAIAIARKDPRIGGATLAQLHAWQTVWRARQCASLQEYFRSAKAGDKHDPNAVIPGDWPIVPAPGPRQEALA
jgi:DNA polymerase-3 subunit epsilon